VFLQFPFKYKALDVNEGSPAHCVHEVSTTLTSAYPPSFLRLAQKTGNQPIRLQITEVS